MMIVETWAHCFGVAPPNICITPLSTTYFLFSSKIIDCIWEVRVTPEIKNINIPNIGLTDCQEAVMDKPNKYSVKNLLKQITTFRKKNAFYKHYFEYKG